MELLVSVEGEKDYTFEKRFSLKYREPLIRSRFLDPELKVKYGFPAADLSLPMSEFRQLSLEVHRCFITENLMTFLTLPPLDNSFALFGMAMLSNPSRLLRGYPTAQFSTGEI